MSVRTSRRRPPAAPAASAPPPPPPQTPALLTRVPEAAPGLAPPGPLLVTPAVGASSPGSTASSTLTPPPAGIVAAMTRRLSSLRAGEGSAESPNPPNVTPLAPSAPPAPPLTPSPSPTATSPTAAARPRWLARRDTPNPRLRARAVADAAATDIDALAIGATTVAPATPADATSLVAAAPGVSLVGIPSGVSNPAAFGEPGSSRTEGAVSGSNPGAAQHITMSSEGKDSKTPNPTVSIGLAPAAAVNPTSSPPTAAVGGNGGGPGSGQTGRSGETLEANRVRSALEHRRLVYKELTGLEQMLLYHRQWLEQPPVSQSQGMPDPATLDPRGDDLPLDKLHALATQTQVKSIAAKAAAAMDGDRNLLHVDRYVYWHDTKAPPAEWRDVLPSLLALHDVNAGFLVVELGLAPKGSDTKGYTWITGFVDEKWSHYVKYALDATMECSTYLVDPSPWLRGDTTETCDGADRLTHMTSAIRHFRRFPSEEPAITFRRFMQPINPKLVEHLAQRCMIMTVIDHRAGRRDWLLKIVAKVLRNRNKLTNPTSKSKGLNYYVPAIQGLRKERDESQRLHYVRGIQNSGTFAHLNLKDLLDMPLNELRVRYWTATNSSAATEVGANNDGGDSKQHKNSEK
jgi:hypothetical protein